MLSSTARPVQAELCCDRIDLRLAGPQQPDPTETSSGLIGAGAEFFEGVIERIRNNGAFAVDVDGVIYHGHVRLFLLHGFPVRGRSILRPKGIRVR
jgi:hypothetical protein